MSKKKPKEQVEEFVVGELAKHLAVATPRPDGADIIGIGPNGITYTFKVKLDGDREIPDDMNFAEELREKIRQSGLSLLQLAKAASISQPSLHHFMKGTQDIRLQTFNRLAAVMGFELKHRASKMPKTKPAAKKPNG